jgi:hypothetical protein
MLRSARTGRQRLWRQYKSWRWHDGAAEHGSGTPNAAGTALSSEPLVDASTYRLAPGDLIDVKFPYHPEENERVPVRPDGRIGLQVIGDTMAAGLTVKELEDDVVKKSSVTLRDPVVSIVIRAREHKVYVGGWSRARFRALSRGNDPVTSDRGAWRLHRRRKNRRRLVPQSGGRSGAISET